MPKTIRPRSPHSLHLQPPSQVLLDLQPLAVLLLRLCSSRELFHQPSHHLTLPANLRYVHNLGASGEDRTRNLPITNRLLCLIELHRLKHCRSQPYPFRNRSQSRLGNPETWTALIWLRVPPFFILSFPSPEIAYKCHQITSYNRQKVPALVVVIPMTG